MKDRPMDARSSLTRNQQLVLEKLEHAHGPLSAYALLDGLREQGFRAPLQVYRALDRLMKDGLVHRLESLNSFVACSEHHHHAGGMTAFAICGACGQVAELADPAIGERLEAWVADTGFRAEKAVIEFRGVCRACAAKS
jgi:Fur family zinc uptake transcriptional regulator